MCWEAVTDQKLTQITSTDIKDMSSSVWKQVLLSWASFMHSRLERQHVLETRARRQGQFGRCDCPGMKRPWRCPKPGCPSRSAIIGPFNPKCQQEKQGHLKWEPGPDPCETIVRILREEEERIKSSRMQILEWKVFFWEMKMWQVQEMENGREILTGESNHQLYGLHSAKWVGKKRYGCGFMLLLTCVLMFWTECTFLLKVSLH